MKRTGRKCIVRARICPEHKVRDKPYHVTASIDEEAETITEVLCLSCVASLGGCKHAIAFIMWLHRRSEEPAPTEIVCYWKKPILSQVGSTEKFIKARNIGRSLKPSAATTPDTKGFFEETVELMNRTNYICPIASHYSKMSNNLKKLSIHELMIEFCQSDLEQTADSFIEFCRTSMDTKDIEVAQKMSVTQSEESVWHELRYGRITASKLYEMAVCKTASGSLVNQIIGVAKKFDSVAINRGKKLEKAVLMEVQKQLKTKIENSGFIILEEFGVVGASPDGVTANAVIEIKCPISNKTFKRYVNERNEVPKRYLAQINLQMLAKNVTKGYFCIAHSDFESTNKCTIIEITYDADFTLSVIESALSFWKKNVFPVLYNSCK